MSEVSKVPQKLSIDTAEKVGFLWMLFYTIQNKQIEPKNFPLEKINVAAEVKAKFVEKKLEKGLELKKEVKDLTLEEVSFLKQLFDEKKQFTIEEVEMQQFFTQFFKQSV